MMDVTFVSKTYFSGNLLKSDFLERATTKKKKEKKKKREKKNKNEQSLQIYSFCLLLLHTIER